jgi:hypothetical protein
MIQMFHTPGVPERWLNPRAGRSPRPDRHTEQAGLSVCQSTQGSRAASGDQYRAASPAVICLASARAGRRGSPVDFTRTVWPGDTTRLAIGG